MNPCRRAFLVHYPIFLCKFFPQKAVALIYFGSKYSFLQDNF